MFGFVILVVHPEKEERFCSLYDVKFVAFAAERKRCFAEYVFLKGIWWKNKNSIYMWSDLIDHSKKIEYYQFFKMMWC